MQEERFINAESYLGIVSPGKTQKVIVADSCCLFRDLVQLRIFSVPSLCHRTFCASLTPATAVALAALSLCSSLFHHVAPKRRADVGFHESEFRFLCAAFLTLLYGTKGKLICLCLENKGKVF